MCLANQVADEVRDGVFEADDGGDAETGEVVDLEALARLDPEPLGVGDQLRDRGEVLGEGEVLSKHDPMQLVVPFLDLAAGLHQHGGIESLG